MVKRTTQFGRKPMPEKPKLRSSDKESIAVLKGRPEFQSWFKRIQQQTRLPVALLLDHALAEFAKAKGFEELPQR
jgi:hypothetical protein